MTDQTIIPPGELTAAASSLQLPTAIGSGLGRHNRRLLAAAAFILSDVVATLAAQQIAGVATGLLWRSVALAPHPHLGALLVPLIYLCLGCYDEWGPAPIERLRLRICGAGLYVAAELTASLTLGVSGETILRICIAGILLTILGHYGEGLVRGFMVRRGSWGTPVTIVGDASVGEQLAQALMLRPELGLRPVNVIDVARARSAAPFALAHDDAANSVAAQMGTMNSARPRSHVETWLFASPDEFAASNVGRNGGPLPCPRLAIARHPDQIQALFLHARPARSAVGMEIRRDLYVRHCLWLKRLIDCLVAVPAAILAAPIILALALMIKLIDPGPAFYQQIRIGRNGRPIGIWKLRTMRVNAEQRLTEHLAGNAEARLEWQRLL